MSDRSDETGTQRYEPCVMGADGRCTRWSHDHGDDGICEVLVLADTADENAQDALFDLLADVAHAWGDRHGVQVSVVGPRAALTGSSDRGVR